MIQLSSVSVRFGGQAIFDEINFRVGDGERVGLVGPNGSGKTTLLKLMAGQMSADSGSIVRSGSERIGYLPQEGALLPEGRVIDEMMAAFGEVTTLRRDLERLEAEVERADHDSPGFMDLLEKTEAIRERLGVFDVEPPEAKIERVLAGLGFGQDALSRKASTFSGGWRMRLALARLLLSEPTLLLLDEPTNHLDMVARDWLEEFLGRYPRSVVLVAHDRRFMDMPNRGRRGPGSCTWNCG